VISAADQKNLHPLWLCLVRAASIHIHRHLEGLIYGHFYDILTFILISNHCHDTPLTAYVKRAFKYHDRDLAGGWVPYMDG